MLVVFIIYLEKNQGKIFILFCLKLVLFMKKEMKLLLVVSAFSSLAGGLLAPIYAIFVKDIGGDLLTAGGAYSVYAIATGVLIFFMSKWEDSIKHQEKLIVIGYLIQTIGFFGYVFVTKPIHLFIIQALFGVSKAVWTPAYDGIYSKNLDKGKFASEWGIWESMNWTIIGIAALIGGLIANMFGFNFLFLTMFSLSAIGFLFSINLLKKKK
jgi:hypothetical protein